MATYREEFMRIKELHELPTFVPKEHIENDIIPGTVLATVLIAILFLTYCTLGRYIASEKQPRVVYETSYHFTNMTANTMLGALGVYYYIHVLDPNPSVDQLVLGYRSIYPLACMHLGKNLWSLPLAVTIGNESPAKIAHHVAVVLVVLASSCFTTGFNYFGPFLFGILELSSVPLAVVVLFKEHPEYTKKYPKEYTIARMVFALCFLYIRWYLYLPMKWVMLRLVAFRVYMFYDSEQYVVFGMGALTWLATFFIAVLQVYWGILIINSVLKFASKSSNTSTNQPVSSASP
jgi:hypothetical protein